MDRQDAAYVFRFESPGGAAAHVEGYDAADLNYFGSDGTVYRATVEGRQWGPITLHPTPEKRLADLIAGLRRFAASAGAALQADLPNDPQQLWAYIGADAERRRN